MKTIEVKDAAPLASYDTPAEALRAGVGTPRRRQARLDSDLIAGAFIKGHCIKDNGMWLNLSNHRCLAITVGRDGRPTWEVTNEQSWICETNTVPEPMRLIWPQTGSIIEYDPRALLASRLRYPLRMLFAGEPLFNVYFVKGGSLFFVQLCNLTEGLPLLFFSELEPVA
jgi:hypothetical protein